MKPTLAIDIDDVLVPHYGELANYLNGIYKTKLQPFDIIRWRTIDTVTKSTGASREEIIDSVNKFLLSPEFYIDPYPDAITALKKLKPKYRLVIITARAILIQQLTLDWLEKHFPETFDEKVFVGGEDWGSGGKSADKTNALQSLKADILVDDHPRHCAAAANMGIRTIMFGEYSWNQEEEVPDSVERTRDWKEVCQKLL